MSSSDPLAGSNNTFNQLTNSNRLKWVAASISACLLCQLLLSAPLWQAERTFPLLPLLNVPPIAHQITFGIAILSLLSLLIFPKNKKNYWLPLITILLLILFDINRLQVWVYQLSLMLFVITWGYKKQASYRLQALQLMIAATYFWSGFHKLNIYFIEDIFPDLLTQLGIAATPSLAIAAALFEMSLGFGLLWKRSRPYSLWLAIIMHIVILGLLGPVGKSWNPVIWPWNVAMIGIVGLLFYKNSHSILYQLPTKLRQFPIFAGVFLLFVILPVFNLSGHWDEQMSFKMYAGTQPEGIFYFSKSDISCFPEEMQQKLLKNNQANRPGERFIIIAEWAFEEMGTPPAANDYSFKRLSYQLCSCLKTPAGGRMEVIYGHPWDRMEEKSVVTHCSTIIQEKNKR